MSASNGQRARFHINRKRRILRRAKLRTLMQEITSKREPAAAAPDEAGKGPARQARP